MDRKKIALIGCGRISFKHIEAYVMNANRLQFVAACDPRLDRAEARVVEYCRPFPDAHITIFSDYLEMLSRVKPDIVSIATESGLHADIAVKCLESGAHVICEKPMALSTADADRMIVAARKAGRTLTVCFQNRFNAPVQKARTAFEAGRFGRMLHGSVQVRWNRNESYYQEAPWRGTWEQDGGTLMNQCTHGIDLLQWMMGEDAVRVQAATRRFQRRIDAEDYGSAIVEFKSGAVGIIEGTANVYPINLDETLSLFGTTATVVIGGIAVNKVNTWRFMDAEKIGDVEAKVLNPEELDPPTVYGFGHSALFADVLDAIDSGREPLVSGAKGKKALEIILAIYRSQKTGKPVDLPVEFSTLEMKGYFS
jgi:UDP-N-acetyl-2-amino-2-deoxyglucuronate dehydrogenase